MITMSWQDILKGRLTGRSEKQDKKIVFAEKNLEAREELIQEFMRHYDYPPQYKDEREFQRLLYQAQNPDYRSQRHYLEGKKKLPKLKARLQRGGMTRKQEAELKRKIATLERAIKEFER
jgi:succinate dehydrogenase/fumarate reductase flavoprotein subunit